MQSWVFAYGSNMDLGDFARWCRERGREIGRITRAECARVEGHRLVWNYHSRARAGGAANVEQASGVELFGVALEVCPTALAALDAKEGHPNRYRRSLVGARLLGSEERIDAWLYAVEPSFVSSGIVPPRRAYLELLIQAARQHGLPQAYIDALVVTPTAD